MAPRRISPQEMAKDVHDGLDRQSLQEKYRVSEKQFDGLLRKLVELGHLSQSDVDSVGLDPTARKALGLFQFLRAFAELGSTVVRDLSRYQRVIWLDSVPQEPECVFNLWSEGTDEEEVSSWLEVTGPSPTNPPPVPAELEPWVKPNEIRDAFVTAPTLLEESLQNSRSQGTEASEVPEGHKLGLGDELEREWQAYLEKWRHWAENERRLIPIQKIYQDLFSIHQLQSQASESYELVIGIGYLTWVSNQEQLIKRHILACPARIGFDPKRKKIVLEAPEEDPGIRLEQDMLEIGDLPRGIEQRVAADLKKIETASLDKHKVEEILKDWIHSFSEKGIYSNSLTKQADVTHDPEISLAPALILRKRSERKLVTLLKNICADIKHGQAIPGGIKNMVDSPGDSKPVAIQKIQPKDPTLPEKILFPLAFNESQIEIVERLAASRGVVVQGPPGTGKSQTIANLICHLLAHGEKVLVTSHGGRALKVLKSFIPEDIVPLCLALMDHEQGTFQELEGSVNKILTRSNNWDPDKNNRKIRDLEDRLKVFRRQEQEINRKLRSIREEETYKHSALFDQYSGTAKEIAQKVVQEKHVHSWMNLQADAQEQSPLTNNEALELLELLRELEDRWKDLDYDFVHHDDLLTPTEFTKSLERIRKATSKLDGFSECLQYRGFNALLTLSPDELQSFMDTVVGLQSTLRPTEARNQDWLKNAARDVLTGSTLVWETLLKKTHEELETVAQQVDRVSTHKVSGLDHQNLAAIAARAKALLEHLQAGGSLGLGPFKPKVVKNASFILKEIQVDGIACNKPEFLEILLSFLDVHQKLEGLDQTWSQFVEPPQGNFQIRLARYQDLAQSLAEVLELPGVVEPIVKEASRFNDFKIPKLYSLQEVERFRKVIHAAQLKQHLSQMQEPLVRQDSRLRRELLNGHIHPSYQKIVDSTKLGDENLYSQAYSISLELAKLREKRNRFDALFSKLKDAAPELAEWLVQKSTDPLWEDRMGSFAEAWNWARAQKWLFELYDPDYQKKLSTELNFNQQQIVRIVGELAAAKAWGNFLENMSDEVKRHLKAWLLDMKNYGKGTGKWASTHLQNARDNLNHCLSTIPAWIMPIHRVVETVKTEPEAFDVVIVDEASQSGPEALILEYLAKKIVVVGDAEQISPQFFVKPADVETLKDKYLKEIPFKAALGIDNSFFDLAYLHYGTHIQLQEHFRCMPEIIQFCNSLCYNTKPLEPLRQYGRDRLEPVINTVFVEDGYVEGKFSKVINEPEAEAIVDRIKKCCEDSRYAKKTLGVINLLGIAQGKLIEEMLRKEIGPEEMANRRLIGGIASEFQGDERDVIFLSMVSAPNQKIGTLADAKARRRFNVAVSRAKDQLWLFHSATINDLNQKCFRYKLLEYCENPTVEKHPSINDGYLIKIRKDPNKELLLSKLPFDSWFEVDVYLKIRSRGFRVIPQYQVAGYSIDLVVEGMRGRMAVECDGDHWHGADRWDADAARQRKLERCGWTFWRVRESSFYFDQEGAMADLWSVLDEHKITPGPAKASSIRTTEVPDTAKEPTPPTRPPESPPVDEPNERIVESSQTAPPPIDESPTTIVEPIPPEALPVNGPSPPGVKEPVGVDTKPRESILPETDIRIPVLRMLYDLGGVDRLEKLPDKLHGYLIWATEDPHVAKNLPRDPSDRIYWAIEDMKRKGWIREAHYFDGWEITEAGKKKLNEMGLA